MLSPVLLWVLCVWWWCVWSRVRVRVFLVHQVPLAFWLSGFRFIFIRATPCKLAPLRVCLCVCVSVCVCVVLLRYVISNDTAMLIQYKTWLATSTRIASCHAYYIPCHQHVHLSGGIA